jgi:hypothetical protein
LSGPLGALANALPANMQALGGNVLGKFGGKFSNLKIYISEV